MELCSLDILTGLDEDLAASVAALGRWAYLLLFVLVCLETALFLGPFLPGDSVLFVAGAVAARGLLNVHAVVALLVLATGLGDTINYALGRFGGRWLQRTGWLKPDHLARGHSYFARYGGRTLVFTRFIPVVRMVTPLVAGMSRMPYPTFVAFNLVGVSIWVTLWVYGAYGFGQLPFIQKHMVLIVPAAALLCGGPAIVRYLLRRRAAR